MHDTGQSLAVYDHSFVVRTPTTTFVCTIFACVAQYIQGIRMWFRLTIKSKINTHSISKWFRFSQKVERETEASRAFWKGSKRNIFKYLRTARHRITAKQNKRKISTEKFNKCAHRRVFDVLILEICYLSIEMMIVLTWIVEFHLPSPLVEQWLPIYRICFGHRTRWIIENFSSKDI